MIESNPSRRWGHNTGSRVSDRYVVAATTSTEAAALFNNYPGATMKQLQIPPLSEGETYIGAIGDTAGDVYHVILLPGDNDDATFEKQLEWAKSIGGDLPTRVEQAMLWAKHRDLFQKDWYWSNEEHHSESGWAWSQNFTYGTQDSIRKGTKLRARAVRRLPI